VGVSDELSPRARAILDAAERLAGGQPSPPAAPAPAPPPASDSPPATAAQLAALAEQVRLTIETVRTRMDELTARVDALAAQLATPPAPSPPPTPGADDAPRLLAVELAVAGATRADVDARLRERFGVSSTAELLDEVFGVGSAPSARLPWGGGAAGVS
jgi:hypothetical protein